MYIFSCSRIWASVSSVASSVPVCELHAFAIQPGTGSLGFIVWDSPHRGDQRGLAEAFLVDAAGVEQFIFDDGVVHAHAALVEDAHDGFVVLELPRPAHCPKLSFGAGSVLRVQVADVTGVMRDLARRGSTGGCRQDEIVVSKSSLQMVLYLTPILVRQPFRLSMPTSPGHCPDQLATVRIGPRWSRSPASTW